MCTVSFVSTDDKIIITSNRDEKIVRENAIPPKEYLIDGKRITFPKDPKAGGTWYAVDEFGTIIVLLNGGREKHISTPPYQKSRGLVVLDIIASVSPKDFWEEINLENIEPFTLFLHQNYIPFELVWTGRRKETTILNKTKNYIWSSSTLYAEEIRAKRANEFYDFLTKTPVVSEKELKKFHSTSKDSENGFVINRNNTMKTLSITQSVVQKDKISLFYWDLITKEKLKKII